MPTGTENRCFSVPSPASKTSSRLSGVLTAQSIFPLGDRPQRPDMAAFKGHERGGPGCRSLKGKTADLREQDTRPDQQNNNEKYSVMPAYGEQVSGLQLHRVSTVPLSRCPFYREASGVYVNCCIFDKKIWHICLISARKLHPMQSGQRAEHSHPSGSDHPCIILPHVLYI